MIKTIFSIAIIIVMAISMVVYSNIKNIDDTNKIVTYTYETIENLNSLNLTLIQFESTIRGSLLSNRDNSLEYSMYNEQVFSKLDRLKKTSFQNQQQKDKLIELIPLIFKRTKILNQLVDLKTSNYFDYSKDRDKVILGSELMMQINRIISEMKDIERESLEDRRKKELNSTRISFLLFLSGVVLSFLLLSIAFYLIRKELKTRIKAENQLDAILNHSMNVIFLKDLQGKYLIINRRFEELFNVNNKKLKGKTAYDLFPKETADSIARHDNLVLSSKKPIQFDETNFINGVKRSFISIRFPLLDTDGEIYAICGMSTEITERQKKEDEIKELNMAMAHNISELQTVNKEVEAFSYSISHDLRSPLRAIGGFSRALMEDFYDKFDDDGRRYLKNIIDNSQRMGQLIDDLLAFSKLGRRQIVKSEVNMQELVDNVIDELKQTDTFHRCKIEIGDLPSINADSSMMKQVFINLLSNAGKFTRHIQEPVIIIDSFSSYLGNIYYVKDNGAGFNMKYIDKLFGVFQRLHSDTEFEGTGVGLALVQRIINKHEGEVWAQAEINEGATFYFSLPKT